MKGRRSTDQLNPGVHVEFEHVDILWNPFMCFYIFNSFNLILFRQVITSVNFLKPTMIQEIWLLKNVFIWQRHLVNFFNKHSQCCLDILKEYKWPHSASIPSNYPMHSQWVIYSFLFITWCDEQNDKIGLIKLTKHHLFL